MRSSHAASDPSQLAHYEGLVRSTATRYAPLTEDMDFDDVCQVLRLKVWQALEAFSPARSKLPVERYVFGCVRNRAKDLVKRRTEEARKRDPLYIEDVAPTVNGNGSVRDAFELRYLSDDEEQALANALDTPPLVPSTLTDREKCVLVLLYNHYKHPEIAVLLHCTKREVATAVRGIREKMADWIPDSAEWSPSRVVHETQAA